MIITTEPTIQKEEAKEPTVQEMLKEMEEAFPQFQESFNRLATLYNKMLRVGDEMKKIQEELDVYKEGVEFCTSCGDVFRREDLKNGLCPEHSFELYDRHSGEEIEEDFIDIEFEEIERPY